jgi:Holliday junction resolvase RusA-like endonuclease
LTLRYFVTQEPDDDNLTCWFKAGRDGLYDAGYVTNDRRFVQMPPQWELVKHRKDRRLEVTVEEITDGS